MDQGRLIMAMYDPSKIRSNLDQDIDRILSELDKDTNIIDLGTYYNELSGSYLNLKDPIFKFEVRL